VSEAFFHGACEYCLEANKTINCCEPFGKFTSTKAKIIEIFRRIVFLWYLIIWFRVKLSLISIRAATVSFLSKLKDIISLDDQDSSDHEYEDIEQYPHNYDGDMASVVGSSAKVSTPRFTFNPDSVKSSDYSMNSMPEAAYFTSSVVMIEPRAFEEMPLVIDALRQQKSVILNMALVRQEEAQRALDFAAGGTYAIDGHYERIGDNIFLFTPSSLSEIRFFG
jgi:cell division inhibitor SepF